MKLQLDEFDMQMEELDAQIHQLQIEEQHKATGNQEETPESADKEAANGGEAELHSEETAHSLKAMSALISAGSEWKQTDSTKAAQLTLYSDAKEWEHHHPERSAKMLRKAESLDGKLFEAAGSISDKLADAQQGEQTGSVRGTTGDRDETMREKSGETPGSDNDPSGKTEIDDKNDPRTDREDEAISADNLYE